MKEEEKPFLEGEINRQYRWYNMGSRVWSAVHHWSLAVSAFLSAAATLVLKSDWIKTLGETYLNDVAAGLAATATVITTLAATGGFGRKWQANRRSRGQIEQIKIDFSSPEADSQKTRDELKRVIKEHDETIIGPIAQ